MPKRKDRDSERFRFFVDDRSGFEYGFQPITEYPNAYTRESGRPINDLGLKVNGESYDMPPPSKKSLGGEGDISGDPRQGSGQTSYADAFAIPTESVKNIVYVNSSSSIAWNTDPIVYIVGSNASQVMSVTPQLSAGVQNQQIALECVGSSVTLINGSGITILGFSRVVMNSGAVSVFVYQTDGTAWNLTSFNPTGGF